MSMEKFIEFNDEKAKRLKKAYGKAVADGLVEFEFEGQTLYTPYARYLLEFIEMELHK